MERQPQFAHRHEVPIQADSVASPIVHYGTPMTAIHFRTEDGRWGRITFERLDSLRVSRGEYEPFPNSPDESGEFNWVTTVSNSAWLRERYEYEKEHYGQSYNFSGNVDEMLGEFCHYVFSFHDQFVEAIAAGIWFETDFEMLSSRGLDASHPLKGLTNAEVAERFVSYGITCSVRKNPLKDDEIERAARLCSQTILEIGAELDGRSSPSWFLTHRIKNNIGKTYLRNRFGNPVESFDAIPSLSEIRPRIDQWLSEVRENRRQMRKD